MPNTSAQIATLLSNLYASSANSASALSYSVMTKKTAPPEKRAAYLGKTVANTTQAVTHALVAAGLSGARGVAEASLAASGLSLLCSLPSAIDALSSLGVKDPKVSTENLYKQSEKKSIVVSKALKTSLLVTGPTKHDNLLRLLFNFPLDVVREKSSHDLFPLIQKKLIKQKRGDAISFYKKWLRDDAKQKSLFNSFNQSLANYDKPSMKAPIISIGEVAAFLSLLDPETDESEIAAFSNVFKEMLLNYRKRLSPDINLASMLDESNQMLMNLMVNTYTGRAHRKKVQAKNLKIGKHILTGVGVVLSAALAVHTAGLSIPATVLLSAKISSTSVGVLSTATRVAQMVKEGSAAEDIASLLSEEVIETLSHTTLSQELLDSAEKTAHDFDSQLEEIIREIKSLNRQTHHKNSEIEKTPLYLILKLEKEGVLFDVLKEADFMASLDEKIAKEVSPPELYRQMIAEIEAIRALPGTPAFRLKRAKLDILNVTIHYLMSVDELVSGTLKACAQKGEAAVFIKGTFEKEREQASSLHLAKTQNDKKISLLSSLEDEIGQQKRLFHMNIGLYQHHATPPSSTGKLLKANDYLESIEETKTSITKTLEISKATLLDLEGVYTRKTDANFTTSV